MENAADMMTGYLGLGGMPAAQWVSLAMMVVGLTALMWTLRRQLKRRAAARHAADETPSERLEAIRREAQLRQASDSGMAQSLELAQRLAAQLDGKAARLERLIADADDRLRRLERALAAAEQAPAPMNGQSAAAAAGDDPMLRKVYALADEGLPPVEIARRLGQHTGKVELILALRQR